MGQHAKELLQIVLIAAVLTTLGIWIVPSKPILAFWATRLTAPTLATACGLLLWRASKLQERLPNLLGQMFGGKYFEAEGVSFAVAISRDEHRTGWLHIYAQNRYAGAAHLRVVLKPPKRSFSLKHRKGVPNIDETMLVESGAFVLRRIPIVVNEKYLGRGVRYEVFGSARYRRGRATLLRYKQGIYVGRPPNAGDIILMLLGAIGGIFIFRRPASLTLQFPNEMTAHLPVGLTLQDEVLWTFQGVPQGFPVIAHPQTRAA